MRPVRDPPTSGLGPMAAVSLTALATAAYWPVALLLAALSALGIWCTLRLHAAGLRREGCLSLPRSRAPVT